MSSRVIRQCRVFMRHFRSARQSGWRELPMRPRGEVQPASEFAAAAEALRSERPVRNPRLSEAESALRENRLGEAHEMLSRFVEKHPNDPLALHLMADAALRL